MFTKRFLAGEAAVDLKLGIYYLKVVQVRFLDNLSGAQKKLY